MGPKINLKPMLAPMTDNPVANAIPISKEETWISIVNFFYYV